MSLFFGLMAGWDPTMVPMTPGDVKRGQERFVDVQFDSKDLFAYVCDAYTRILKTPGRKARWAALEANPDYESARINLRTLEGMSPGEFARKHRAGGGEGIESL